LSNLIRGVHTDRAELVAIIETINSPGWGGDGPNRRETYL